MTRTRKKNAPQTNPPRGGPPTIYPGKGRKSGTFKMTDVGWKELANVMQQRRCSMSDAIEGKFRGDF